MCLFPSSLSLFLSPMAALAPHEAPPFVYRCTECGGTYTPGDDRVRYLCPSCRQDTPSGCPSSPLHGVLEVALDYEWIRRRLAGLPPTAAVDCNLFCPVPAVYHPPLAVGGTPLVCANRLAHELGFEAESVWVKNEGLNPSGSLKDRASFLVVAEANRLHEDRVIVASTGNAAAATATLCAAAGKQAVIFVPENAPQAKLCQSLVHGANVVRVRGTYDDAVRMSFAEVERSGSGLCRNTAYHPFTIDGKKTVAFEIWEQCGRVTPDVVVVPMGDGVILAGVFRGFSDLVGAGLASRMPRLLGVQAERSDAIHRLVTTGTYQDANDPSTVADSISVSAPSNALMAARAIHETHGKTILVSDHEILEAQGLLARTAGIFTEPAGAAAVAGLCKSARTGDEWLPRSHARIVILATGMGLKDVGAALQHVKLPDPVDVV